MVSAWWAIGVFLLGAYAGTLVFALMSVAAREHAQGVKEEEATNSASFVDDLGADSLDTVELVMALEEEFECEIPDEEAEKITSVQQAIDYIKAHVKA